MIGGGPYLARQDGSFGLVEGGAESLAHQQVIGSQFRHG
jgi:hypothetical protein